MVRALLVAIIPLLVIQSAASAAAVDYELRALSGPRADVAALILGGRESGSLRATGLALASCAETDDAAANGTPSVQLTVEIEARSLLDVVSASDPKEIPDSVRIEIYVYVMTRAGEIVQSLNKWVRLPLATLADKLPGGGVKLLDRLDIPPGEYQARLLVRESRSQQFSLRILDVVVPARNGAGMSISPPLFPDSPEPWLVARGAPAANEKVFSALPVLGPQSRELFAVRGCGLDRARLSARLLDREGTPADALLTVGAPTLAGGEQKAEGTIEIRRLQAGLYRLEVTARSAQTEITRSLPVFVSETHEVSAWTAIGGLASDTGEADETPELADPGESAKPVRAIENRYRKVLELLAAGQLERSVAALSELESRAIEGHENPRKAFKWLTEAQNRVTRRLLDHDPECLLPLLMLHLELQARYVAGGDTNEHLLSGTRTRIRSLAQVYATDTGQEMAAALASSVLVELAQTLRRSGYLTSALVVLREALALDRSNTSVLLDLAYQYEHHGFRTEALALLQRLLELDSGSDEARLRLAVTLSRMQKQGEALEILRQVIDTASAEWVLAVAYEEIGLSLLRENRFDQAVEALREAVSRLPDIQRLRIQLAYALDRTGRRSEGREILAELPPDRGRSSPRLRYRVREDTRSDDRSRREISRHGTARLPLLAAALAEDRTGS